MVAYGGNQKGFWAFVNQYFLGKFKIWKINLTIYFTIPDMWLSVFINKYLKHFLETFYKMLFNMAANGKSNKCHQLEIIDHHISITKHLNTSSIDQWGGYINKSFLESNPEIS